jgi:hypothetical protein
VGGASLDFYPYSVIEYKLEMSKNDPSGKKHNIQNREMVNVDAFNGELLSLTEKKRKSFVVRCGSSCSLLIVVVGIAVKKND